MGPNFICVGRNFLRGSKFLRGLKFFAWVDFFFAWVEIQGKPNNPAIRGVTGMKNPEK